MPADSIQRGVWTLLCVEVIRAIHHWDTGVTTYENSIQENPKRNENNAQSLTRQDRASRRDCFPMESIRISKCCTNVPLIIAKCAMVIIMFVL